MLKPLSEKQIENQILSFLKSCGIFAFKVKSMGTFDPKRGMFRSPSPWYRKGVSDILCCIAGRFVAFEVKTPKGRLSDHQKLFLKDVESAGGVATVVRSVDDVKSFLEGLDSYEHFRKTMI